MKQARACPRLPIPETEMCVPYPPIRTENAASFHPSPSDVLENDDPNKEANWSARTSSQFPS